MLSDFIEKYHKNLTAFVAGVTISGSIVWIVYDKLHNREIAILERTQADLQKRLTDTKTELKDMQQTLSRATPSPVKASHSVQKQDIEGMIKKLDGEIKQKKLELASHSPIMWGEPTDDGYKRVEDELHTLQKQKDDSRQRLIQVLGE
jgi:peptidoglycan hydrolase CwlO-like protein